MKRNALLAILLMPLPAAAADWHVVLTVTAPDDMPPVRVDSNNIFGRLHDSVDGLDSHDLPEMAPPSGSMGDRYLSIVFPHPEWGGNYDGYASDFRAAADDETESGCWKFEVRTRTPGIRTVVSWQEGAGNPLAVLPRSRIRDAASGAVIVADTSLSGSFTLSDTKSVNAYIWEYLDNPCGCGRALPVNTWLMTAPACQPADPPSISTQYGGGIPGGAAAYNTSWIGWNWDAAAQNYPPKMAAADPLALGFGNWLYSTNAGTVRMVSGTATTTTDWTGYGLGQCFEIDLVIPPAGQNRWNFVGHPFPYAVSWTDVRVAVSPVPDGSAMWTVYSLSQAESAGYVSKNFHRWNGNGYDPYDDVTLGGGTLQPQEAVWVRSIGSYSYASVPEKLKLLIPAR